MYILGIQSGSALETEFNRDGFSHHDAAAVLLKDGEIVAAIEEERLSRAKHCNFFPVRSIDFCLQQANIKLSDVDYIAVHFSEHDARNSNINSAFEDSRVSIKPAQESVADEFKRLYYNDVSQKLVFCSHHLAHVWSATAMSDFDESLVAVFDGNGPSGDGRMLSGLLGVSRKDKFTIEEEIPAKFSLGHFYIRAIRLVGYNRFDEYKVMGLAPYGDPERYRKQFQQLAFLGEKGQFEVHRNPGLAMWKMLGSSDEFKSPRRKGEEFTQAHKDYAAGLQETLEVLVMHKLTYAREHYGLNKLCMAGGVAHNCTLNGKILESNLFDEMFVQPASHDAGGALGAALYAHNQKATNWSNQKLKHLFYGTNIPESDRIEEVLSRWEPVLEVEPKDNVAQYTAEQIADGAIVAWYQGRSEFGPRALGNRSILADPRPAENRNRINAMVKKREGYRPFAPSVLAERADDYFDITRYSSSLQFMNIIVPVKEHHRDGLGAITHVDGTARIQVVTKEANPRYWDLISRFGGITGVPILLNTSFNNNVEPIVDTIENAIASFLTTNLTMLVIGDFVIRKNKAIENYIGDFNLGLRPCYKLCQGFTQSPEGFKPAYTLEFTSSRYFAAQTAELSKEVFRLLSCIGEGSIATIANKLNIEIEPQIISELLTLWDRRFIELTP